MVFRNRLLVKLLLLDQAVASRSENEVALEAERNYRWNFVANLLDGAAFWFGIAFISSSTIVPLFVTKVTLSPIVIGFVAMLAQAGWYLPQLLTAGMIERLDRKKPVVVNLGFFLERLPTWLWPLAALTIVVSPVLGLILFIVGYAWHNLGAGMIGPAWQDLLARCFPLKKRGRLFGLTTFIGTGAGTVGAGLSSWFLSYYAYPYNFMSIFLVAAVAVTLSWLFIAQVREPVQHVVVRAEDEQRLWPKMYGILRQDLNFRHYLLFRVLMVLGTMGTAFITVAAVERWHVPDSVVGIYTAILLLGQTVGSLLAGLLADRWGHKLPLQLAGAAQIAAFAFAWLLPSAQGAYTVFALLGFSMAINMVSGILVILEFSAPERRPTYIGIANTIVGIANGIAPLVGGWLAGFGYQWLFGMSAVIGTIAWFWLSVGVRDPRQTTVAQTSMAESV